MSYSSQCLACQHARRGTRQVKIAVLKIRGPLPIGCGKLSFPATAGPGNFDVAGQSMVTVMNALLYQAAAKGDCVAYERMVVQPEAYFSQDLP